MMFNKSEFIATRIIRRPESMFLRDISAHREELSARIQGRRVLVIGGAGSIGSSFIRALLPFCPAGLVVVDVNENALTELTRDLRSTPGMHVPEEYLTYSMNFSDPIFARIFRQYRGFDIVANFSAHKHVRSEKDRWSVQALLENNVLNAQRLLDLLAEFPPEHFFCVSTDKAANPVNIMGASKRMMEDLIMAYSPRFKVTTARFANVAFSNGSLTDGFCARLEKRQPLSAPSDVRRYFVSPEESGQICLLACVLGQNREIFFPRLREDQMLTFPTIVRDFLSAHGLEAYICQSEDEARDFSTRMPADPTRWPVYLFVSDTTGEKGFEEFFVEGEHVDLQRFTALGVIDAVEAPPLNQLQPMLDALRRLLEKDETTKGDIVRLLQEMIPTFRHEELARNLDQKM